MPTQSEKSEGLHAVLVLPRPAVTDLLERCLSNSLVHSAVGAEAAIAALPLRPLRRPLLATPPQSVMKAAAFARATHAAGKACLGLLLMPEPLRSLEILPAVESNSQRGYNPQALSWTMNDQRAVLQTPGGQRLSAFVAVVASVVTAARR